MGNTNVSCTNTNCVFHAGDVTCTANMVFIRPNGICELFYNKDGSVRAWLKEDLPSVVEE